jgi:hypothetical protein
MDWKRHGGSFSKVCKKSIRTRLSPVKVCVATSDFAFSATKNQSLTMWKKAKNIVITQTLLGENAEVQGELGTNIETPGPSP